MFIDMEAIHNQLEKYLLIGSWYATLEVLARFVIDMIKCDMCANFSKTTLEIESIVDLLSWKSWCYSESVTV